MWGLCLEGVFRAEILMFLACLEKGVDGYDSESMFFCENCFILGRIWVILWQTCLEGIYHNYFFKNIIKKKYLNRRLKYLYELISRKNIYI